VEIAEEVWMAAGRGLTIAWRSVLVLQRSSGMAMGPDQSFGNFSSKSPVELIGIIQ
jgi:hypothetical protein